jgi:hypothetical protein
VVESLRWGDFLTLVQAKNLPMQYSTGTDSYTIWAIDGLITYRCQLIFSSASAKYPFPYPDGYTATQNNTDVSTFTTTYQATANVNVNNDITLSTQAKTSTLTSASVSISSSGNNTVISEVASTTIRVFRIFLVAAAAVNITIYNGATALTGALPMTANGSIVLDFDTVPWFVTTGTNNFIINLSSAVAVTGTVYYTQS